MKEFDIDTWQRKETYKAFSQFDFPCYHVCRSVPAAVKIAPMLHSLLAIADIFRIGRAREVELAKVELDSILSTYDVR